jgi:signal transduction histidine kinase
MSLFAWAGLSLSILCLILAFVILKYAENSTHRIWGIFNLFISLWGGGTYLAGIAKTSSQAILYWNLSHIPAIFIAILFYHFIHSFCKLPGRLKLILVYLQGLVFLFFIAFTDKFINSTVPVFNILYYAATPVYSIFLAIWCLIVFISFCELFHFIRVNKGEIKTQSLFLFWGMLLGFLGGITTVLPAYNIILIYPAWHFSICIYAFIVTYALLRHNLLGIQVNARLFLIPAILSILAFGILIVINFKPSLFALAGLSLGVLCLLLAFIVLAYSKQKVHRLWAFFNTAVALWGFGTCLAGLANNSVQAIESWRITYLPCTFIAIAFYHLICAFCNINRKKMIIFAYAQGILFLPLIYFSPYFVNSTSFLFDSIHYHVATPLFIFWMAIFVSIAGAAFLELFMFIRTSQGIKRAQALYLFWGMALGWAGGLTTLLPPYNLNIVYPAYHFTICIYAFMMTYAIFRYQIMDIKIAVTRLGILVLVYSIVLAWGREWLKEMFGTFGSWVPMLTLLGFATAGPFIFLYMQRRVEERLLQEDQKLQELLEGISYGMNTIHNLEKLLNLIVDVVVKTLRLDSARIFLLDREAENYISEVPEDKREIVLDKGNPLILELKKKQYPLVHDEIKMLSDGGDKDLLEVESQMRSLSASIVVPIVLNNSLLGFLTLGERKSKAMYTRGLLNTLSILGNQAGLAIDRCNYIAAETKRLEGEGLKERMLSLDHMASSMAHEIDNPMHIIRSSLSFVKDFLLKDARVSSLPTEIKNDFEEAIVRSLQAGDRVSGMIKAILDYSRMGTGKLEAVSIRDAWDGFMQLIQPQIKEEKVLFATEIENDLPPVLGDRVQMEEIFMNFVRNSLHAIRRNEEKKISLKIFRKNGNIVRIECSDNGYGIPKEIINDIFLSSMTTKGSSEGTGLGLYRVRKIVDLFGGKVWAESDGKGKGAIFIVELPVYEGNKNDNGKKMT